MKPFRQHFQQRCVSQGRELGFFHHVVRQPLDKRTRHVVRGDRVGRDGLLYASPNSVVPLAVLNAAIARSVFAPGEPSISPGENPARSRPTCSAKPRRVFSSSVGIASANPASEGSAGAGDGVAGCGFDCGLPGACDDPSAASEQKNTVTRARTPE